MSAVIEVTDVSKTFRRHSAPAKSLKERFIGVRRGSVSTFKALDGVSLTVARGETVGLLGHNGSGKSTLLKCIAGTIRPNRGSIRVEGRIAAMLELGAGFHPDLTGRENIFLNAAILGIPREQVTRIFDDIVEFAELEDFIEEQVKHYSSGMYARLGFAVAVNLEPDILLVDEVLSVGDENFQRKCLERVRQFQAEGRSIVFVTHAPDQMAQLCDRALVLESGRPIFTGEAPEAAAAYRQALHERAAAAAERELAEVKSVDPTVAAVSPPRPPGDNGTAPEPPAAPAAPRLRITHASAANAAGSDRVAPGDDVTLVCGYEVDEAIPDVRVRVIVTSHDGFQVLNASTYDLGSPDVGHIEGRGEIRFTIERLPLRDGTYRVGFLFQDTAETRHYQDALDATGFTVHSGTAPYARVEFSVRIDHVVATVES